jgi:ABC-type transporter lipoprotein component MlaA
VVFDSRVSQMNWSEFSSTLEYWGYRIGHYLLLSFMDDPAWLALMFC